MIEKAIQAIAKQIKINPNLLWLVGQPGSL